MSLCAGVPGALGPIMLVMALGPVGCAPARPDRADAVTRGSVETLTECPAEELLAELHATAFYLQQGANDEGRRHLARAHVLASTPVDPVAAEVMARLDLIAARGDADPSWASTATEEVRATFATWTCLAEGMHRHFHERLPLLP